MRRHLIFAAEEVGFLRELTRHRVPFMVVGLAAAALQGAPMVTQDVDLWFRDITHPGIRKALRKAGGILVASATDRPPMFVGDSVDGFDVVLTVHGIGAFDEEIAKAIRIPMDGFTLAVLPLDRIIASKRWLNREKDRAAIPALESAAKAIGGSTRGGRKRPVRRASKPTA